MKIGIVCYPTHGGSGVVASELGIAMAERGHEVHVFSYRLPFRLNFSCSKIHFHKVSISEYPLFKYPPYTLSLANELVEKILEFDLDIIHSHYAIPHGSSAFLASQLLGEHHVKMVTTLHGTDITLVGREKDFFRITKHVIETSDAVTSVSDWLKKETEEVFGIKRDIEVIPNFLDQRDFAHLDDCPGYPIKRKVPVLCHVSNLRPVKRPHDVIYAFAKVLEKMDCQLNLVGDGPELDSVMELARELNVIEKVCFKGQRDDVLEVLHCSDLFLLPSNKESFGLAALESMGCGVPVIGYRAGGLAEVVEHGVTGYLAEAENVDEFANYCVSLLSDHQKIQDFKAASKKRAFERFGVNLIIDEYEKFYQSVLDS